MKLRGPGEILNFLEQLVEELGDWQVRALPYGADQPLQTVFLLVRAFGFVQSIRKDQNSVARFHRTTARWIDRLPEQPQRRAVARVSRSQRRHATVLPHSQWARMTGVGELKFRGT